MAALAACFGAPSQAGFLSSVAHGLGQEAIKRIEKGVKERHVAQQALPTSGSAAPGFLGCPQFFPGGIAPALPAGFAHSRLRQLCYDAFAVLHSGSTKTPIYAVEKLDRDHLDLARRQSRTDVFYADARLPRAERAELIDYVGSGYDKGHMSPAANQPSAQAMAQSFTLANMVPQAPVNNQKKWSVVEASTRKYVKRAAGPVYVFTGPAFIEARPALNGRVSVPSHLFKLVYDESANRAWAYWMENTNEAQVSTPIPYPELVRKLGIDFLPGKKPLG